MTGESYFIPCYWQRFPRYLYAENPRAGISFAEFIVTFLAIILLSAILLFLTGLIVRNSVKTALIVSLLLVVIFSYGAIYEFMIQAKLSVAGESISRHKFLLAAYALILAAGFGAVSFKPPVDRK